MPQHIWATTPETATRRLEAMFPSDHEIGALAIHAAWAADALYYLADVDHHLCAGVPAVVLGHRADIVDIAHVRWALGTAVTAIDICAAALGRARLGPRPARRDPSPRTLWNRLCAALRRRPPATVSKGTTEPPHEWSLRQLARLRGRDFRKLTVAGRVWVKAVAGDPRYQEVEDIRDRLTHARSSRAFNVGGGAPRTNFPVGEKTIPSEAIIQLARNVATVHVEAFLKEAAGGIL